MHDKRVTYVQREVETEISQQIRGHLLITGNIKNVLKPCKAGNKTKNGSEKYRYQQTLDKGGGGLNYSCYVA